MYVLYVCSLYLLCNYNNCSSEHSQSHFIFISFINLLLYFNDAVSWIVIFYMMIFVLNSASICFPNGYVVLNGATPFRWTYCKVNLNRFTTTKG